MKFQERIDALVQLGKRIDVADERLHAYMHRTQFNNPWFTIENQKEALHAIKTKFLDEEKLQEWTEKYEIPGGPSQTRLGLVLAGNIPLVGFHDILCGFVAGHRIRVKLSDKDKFLLPFLFKLLEEIDDRTAAFFEIIERLNNFDAIIATGSNNSSRYFEAYFGKYPNIIRKNRNAVAVLDGSENEADLMALGRDVFSYFGLGCRNVSKLYLPKDYTFEPLLEAFHEYRDIVLNSKYKNNFDYNFAVLVLNKVQYKANGCILLSENKAIPSSIATLHYEHFDSVGQVQEELKTRRAEIQAVVTKLELDEVPKVGIGKAQEPELWDYADGVDTMEFLLKLY